MSLRTQIWLLLAGVVLLAFTVAALIMSQQTLAGGSRQIAEWVNFAASQYDGDDAAGYRQHAEGSPPLLLSQRELPPNQPATLPLAQAVLRDLRAWRGSDAVRFQAGATPTIWMQSERDPGLWIGVPLRTLRANVAQASWIILAVSALLILAIGAWFSNRLTRALRALAEAAPNLVHGAFDTPTLTRGSSEVRSLAEALNQAASAVHRHYHAREAWLAGFSHDLRTPIARLKFALELEPVALTQRAEIDANLDEIDQLLSAFLSLQRQGLEESVQVVDLAQEITAVVERFRVFGTIEWQPPETPVRIEARPLSLQRAISNLLKNAFDHGQQPVTVSVLQRENEIAIQVRNALADAPMAADRSPGYGMGLAVVRTIASLHGGRFSLVETEAQVEANLILPGKRG